MNAFILSVLNTSSWRIERFAVPNVNIFVLFGISPWKILATFPWKSWHYPVALCSLVLNIIPNFDGISTDMQHNISMLRFFFNVHMPVAHMTLILFI